MPDGVTHYKSWKKFIPVAVTSSIVTGIIVSPVTGGAVMAGYLLGRYIDPDLDQVSITAAEGRLLRELKLIGAFIVAYFFPYAYISKHRSFITHFPVISTFFRIVYMSIPLVVYDYTLFTMSIVLEIYAGILLGLSISDTIHYLIDITN